MIDATFDGTFAGWRALARDLARRGVRPEAVLWSEGGVQPGLWGTPSAESSDRLADLPAAGPLARRAALARELRVPRPFLALAESVACHSAPERWGVLYAVLWRLVHREPHLLDVVTDPDVARLRAWSKAVARDVHKLHAFVRFRRVEEGEGERWIAWFEPEHDVVARAVPFFARRFPSMAWSLLTPRRSAHWDGVELAIGPGVPRAEAPRGDELESLWRTYYASVFNPARVKTRAMRSEMPKKYWANLPEAALIEPLVREAPARVRRMVEAARGPEAAKARGVDAPRGGSMADDAALGGTMSSGGAPRRSPAEALATPDAASAAGTRGTRAGTPNRTLPSPLATPGWCPTRDPGALAARLRASRSAAAWPLAGLAPVRVGTASWTDPTTTAPGVFYPDDAASPELRLRHYASRYPLVEVDSTFYALPTRRLAALWAERTPVGFTFDVKAHATLTGHPVDAHRLPRALRDALPRRLAGRDRIGAGELPREVEVAAWDIFLDALEPLREAGRLGAVLLQFPPWFTPSRSSLRTLESCADRLGPVQGAVEVRHAGWMTERVRARLFSALRELSLAYVMVDGPQGLASSIPPVSAVTDERLAVVRLHGRRRDTWETPVDPVSERYRYLYDAAELAEWVPRIVDVAQRVQGVHVVLNNCHANYGTTNADEIAELLIEADAERRRMHHETRAARLLHHPA